MKITLLFLALTLSVATAELPYRQLFTLGVDQAHKVLHPHSKHLLQSTLEQEEQHQKVFKLISTFRGFWTGLQRGFQKNSTLKLNNKCMSDHLIQDILFVVNFIEGSESIMKTPTFVTTITKIINDSMLYCGYQETVDDIWKFCQKAKKNHCAPDAIMSNAMGQFMNFGSDAYRTFEILNNMNYQTKEDLYLHGMSVGIDLGKVIRGVFGYTGI